MIKYKSQQNTELNTFCTHFTAAEIGYTHQEVRLFEMEQRRPGVSPTRQVLTDWQSKNPTAQDLHDKLHKINRRREMQILEAWCTKINFFIDKFNFIYVLLAGHYVLDLTFQKKTMQLG